ncbi:hypothetical protein V6D40_08315 [Corynebacterium sp. Q4381]|uniref:hypothetical protein n=1 Tax=Corynebacterium sp. Marseille-Q4381 TaxID=3121597 RepID=UPI002FE687AC
MKHSKIGAAAVVALALSTGACGGGAGSAGQTALEAPTFVTLDNLHGADVEITKRQPLVIPVGYDQDASAWTSGGVDDETVATFVPGSKDGNTETNPGFHAVGSGTTGAHLTNPATGEDIEFTITVK